MRLSVRPLTESDITADAALAADVFRFADGEAFDAFARFEQYLLETFDPETFASQMSFESVECLVGHVDDELAGILKLAAHKPLPGIEGAPHALNSRSFTYWTDSTAQVSHGRCSSRRCTQVPAPDSKWCGSVSGGAPSASAGVLSEVRIRSRRGSCDPDERGAVSKIS